MTRVFWKGALAAMLAAGCVLVGVLIGPYLGISNTVDHNSSSPQSVAPRNAFQHTDWVKGGVWRLDCNADPVTMTAPCYVRGVMHDSYSVFSNLHDGPEVTRYSMTVRAYDRNRLTPWEQEEGLSRDTTGFRSVGSVRMVLYVVHDPARRGLYAAFGDSACPEVLNFEVTGMGFTGLSLKHISELLQDRSYPYELPYRQLERISLYLTGLPIARYGGTHYEYQATAFPTWLTWNERVIVNQLFPMPLSNPTSVSPQPVPNQSAAKGLPLEPSSEKPVATKKC